MDSGKAYGLGIGTKLFQSSRVTTIESFRLRTASSDTDLEALVTSDHDDKLPKKDGGALFNTISLVAGTTVGAGILALPQVASEAGFLPTTAGLVGSWVFMATTGLLIAEVCCNLVKVDHTFTSFTFTSHLP